MLPAYNSKINSGVLNNGLECVGWFAVFDGARDRDEFAEKFNALFGSCMNNARQISMKNARKIKKQQKNNAPDLPGSIVKVVHRK